MNRIVVFMLSTAMLLSACTPKEGIEVREARANPASQGANGAVYFVIHNYSEADDALISATTEIAEAVEIHETSMVNDVMQMRMVPSVLLPSGEGVEFEPGGLHIMLVNLKETLEIGASIEITLHFQTHADIPVTVEVHTGGDPGGH